MRILLVLVVTAALAVAVYPVLFPSVELEAVSRPGAVTLVGDSLNVGIAPYLREELADWTIEAHDRVGRGTAEGVDELRRLGRALAPIVVVSLGTNDPDGSESQFRALVAEALDLAGGRCVLWATIVRDGTPRTGFNEILADARGRQANLRLVEWAELVETDGAVLAADLVHGTGEGYARRAEETARAARACPEG
ncbi:MAG: hypothetical protein H0W16_03640 [Actinobacteria bacterium]|nr:hypothetical protein [Actinomycetota bacterium]